MDYLMPVAFAVIVLLVVFLLTRRQKPAVEPPKPLKTINEAVRPNQKDKMQPEIEYCWMSFEGDWGRTVIKYYDLEGSREETIEDRNSQGAAQKSKTLVSQGWQLMAKMNHKEGCEYYFERTRSHA